jgi:hypothetical protein
MKKWSLYFSLFIISASLFLIFTILVFDRKIVFSADIYRYGRIIAKETQQVLETKINSDFDRSVSKVESLLSSQSIMKSHKTGKLEVELQNIANNSYFLNAISLKRGFAKPKMSIKNKNLWQKTNRCFQTFQTTAYRNIYTICKKIGDYVVSFYVDLNLIQKIVDDSYKDRSDTSFSLVHILFFDRNVLYMNLKKGLIIQQKNTINRVKELLVAHKNFDLTLRGKRVYIFPIHLFQDSLKDFYVFLGLSPHNLPISWAMIVASLIVLLICALIFMLGYYFIKNYIVESSYGSYKTKLATNSLIKFQKSNKDLKEIKYPEIKELVDVISEQEKSYLENEGPQELLLQKEKDNEMSGTLKSNKEYLDIIKKIMQKFDVIENSLLCQEQGNNISIRSINKEGQIDIFTIRKEDFLFPLLVQKEDQSFYIYKEAGKTTPVRHFFSQSIFNVYNIEGVILIVLKPHWNQFVIHTTGKEIDHETYLKIYEETLNSFKENK